MLWGCSEEVICHSEDKDSLIIGEISSIHIVGLFVGETALVNGSSIHWCV